MDDKEKAEEAVEASAPKTKAPKVTHSPEQIASRQLAHDIKVAKFLSGGEF